VDADFFYWGAAVYLQKIKNRLYDRVLLYMLKHRRRNARQDTYVFFDNLSSKATEEIDAFTLFECCRDSGIPAVYVAARGGFLHRKTAGKAADGIFFVEDEKESWFLNEELFSVMLRTRAVITSFGCVSGRLEKFFARSANIEYIFIGHGMTFFRLSHLKGYYMSARRYNRILVSNEYEKELMLRHGWREKQIIKTGLPRWDKLARKKTSGVRGGGKVLIFFTWRKTFENTADGAENFEYMKNLRAFLLSDKLREIKENYGVTFCMAGHHALTEQCGIDLAQISGGHVELVSSNLISGLIAESALLITDFSSVFADFYYQSKPVIFYRLDAEDENLIPEEKKDMTDIASRTPLVSNVFYSQEEVFKKLEHYILRGFQMDGEEQKKAGLFFCEKDDLSRRTMERIILG